MLTLVLVMSTSAFAISESDVESAVSASGKEAVSGNVLVWFLCAIAFLKVSQKIDSFLSSLGLNVGHTGGSMLSEAMIAMRAINTATSAVGSALGSRSRHGSAPASGKSGSGSAAAAGFFSGGLVGMARYITKEKSKKGKYQKTWCASKGLRKPKEKVNHYKTKQKDVDRIVKGDLNVCDHLMKWYGDKYDFAEAEVKYNTFNGRFYIYGRMRLRKGTAHDKGKK